MDWANQRICVTGAGGFIGSHLAQILAERGAQVRAFVRYQSGGRRGALEWLPPATLRKIEVVGGDVRDREGVTAAIADRTMVFHLAALVAVPYSYLSPRSFFETNVLGTLNVAAACAEHSVGRLIHTSSSEVYGSAQEIPITGTHPISPQSPYAASKVGADALVESFRRSYDLPTVTVRPFNTYGPRQSARAIVATIIAQALAGDTLQLGDVTPRRDLTFVQDVAEGFLAVGQSDAALGQTVQLGTGEDSSVEDIVAVVGDLLGRDLRVISSEERMRPPNSEVARLLSDPSPARALAGWTAKTGLRDGLARTIEWMREHGDTYRPSEYAI